MQLRDAAPGLSVMEASCLDTVSLNRSLSPNAPDWLLFSQFIHSFRKGPRHAIWLAAALVGIAGISRAAGACPTCEDYLPGIVWGVPSINALSEASGIAASARNPGVLWTHNDGSRKRVYAVSTNGATLSNFNFDLDLDDLEDMAVGPGHSAGTPYLYFGDFT